MCCSALIATIAPFALAAIVFGGFNKLWELFSKGF